MNCSPFLRGLPSLSGGLAAAAIRVFSSIARRPQIPRRLVVAGAVAGRAQPVEGVGVVPAERDIMFERRPGVGGRLGPVLEHGQVEQQVEVVGIGLPAAFEDLAGEGKVADDEQIIAGLKRELGGRRLGVMERGQGRADGLGPLPRLPLRVRLGVPALRKPHSLTIPIDLGGY